MDQQKVLPYTTPVDMGLRILELGTAGQVPEIYCQHCNVWRKWVEGDETCQVCQHTNHESIALTRGMQAARSIIKHGGEDVKAKDTGTDGTEGVGEGPRGEGDRKDLPPE